MNPKVSIVKCEDYSPENVRAAIKQAVDLLGGMEQFVHPGQRVLLKPNLLAAWAPDSGVTTHPAIVEAVIELAREAGGNCALGDSPAFGGESDAAFAKLLTKCGLSEVLDGMKVEGRRFQTTGPETEIPNAKVFHSIPLTDALSDADVLINLPKLKTHSLCIYTGAVKNLFGCVSGHRKAMFHLQAGDKPELFAQMLVDLHKAVKPQLSIMDGVLGMDGAGPSAGRRREFKVVIASSNPVALDAVACMVAGFDPEIVPTLRLASEQGLGPIKRDEIEIVGATPEEVRINDFLLPESGDMFNRVPKFIFHAFRNQLVLSPRIHRRKCIRCNECLKICPAQAIRSENKLTFDYSKCIRCYCCAEVCPREAIYLHAGPLRTVFQGIQSVRKSILQILKREASQ
jgi:uncharacterized protein (DUF362 family)/Pyruvate/2-oxoacid:ferredoxin oxidoreductase delta subunit